MPNEQTAAPTIQFNADGSQTIVGESGETAVLVPGAENDETLSPAMRALRELRGAAKAAPVIRALSAGGRTWFIKKMSYPELTKLGMLAPRDETGRLDIFSESSSEQFMSALFFCALVQSQETPLPLFEKFSEAWQFVNDTDDKVVAALGVLFHGILSINPQVLPTAKRETVDWEGENMLEKKDLKKSPSTTPPTIAGVTSGNETPSNAALA